MIEGIIRGFAKFRVLRNWSIYLVISLIGLFLIDYSIGQPSLSLEKIADINSAILQFSSLFSAILTTYLVSRTIQQREERLNIYNKTVDLSNRLTHFRRICKILISLPIWDKEISIKRINKYSKLNRSNVTSGNKETTELYAKNPEILKEFWGDSQYVSLLLFLDLEDFAGQIPFESELYDDFDHDKVLTISALERWNQNKSGELFYYALEYRSHDSANGIDLKKMTQKNKEVILRLAAKVDDAYQDVKFGPDFLANLGTRINEHLVPKLLRYKNHLSRGLDSWSDFLLLMLTIVLVIGVVIPLINLTFNFNLAIAEASTYFIVVSFIMLFLVFAFNLKRVLLDLVKLSND